MLDEQVRKDAEARLKLARDVLGPRMRDLTLRWFQSLELRSERKADGSIVTPVDREGEDLIRSTKRGIWITRFNYVNGLLEPRTALMTGLTRDGTFLIENGEIVARLPNLRWTQSMVEAFANVEGLTAERRSIGTWYNAVGGTRSPVMKIRGWNITGKQSKF